MENTIENVKQFVLQKYGKIITSNDGKLTSKIIPKFLTNKQCCRLMLEYAECVSNKQLDNHEQHSPQSDVVNPVIDFGVYLTGHDEQTILQMYRDWHSNKK